MQNENKTTGSVNISDDAVNQQVKSKVSLGRDDK